MFTFPFAAARERKKVLDTVVAAFLKSPKYRKEKGKRNEEGNYDQP